MSSHQVGVIGLGNFGTALSQHLALLGHEVTAWDRDEALIDSLNANRSHPYVFSDVELNSGIKFTQNLEELRALETILVVISGSALESFLPQITHFESKIFISAVKGLATSTQTPLAVLDAILPNSKKTAVLSGPGFARDLIDNTPLGIVAGSEDIEVAKDVAAIFSGGCMKVYISDDPLGVELGGILKNVIAIAAGISDGYGFGDSTRAGLVTRGLSEMVRIATAMGAKETTLFGLSGLGDLVLTATCDASRNRRVGLGIGQGKKLEQVLEEIGSTAEGVRSASLVLDLAKKYKVEAPISETVLDIIEGRVGPEEARKRLLSRPTVKEF